MKKPRPRVPSSPRPLKAENYLLFIFDLDGVLYRGKQPIPDAVEAVRAIQEGGRVVYFLTNNSGLTREQYTRRLMAMGIPCHADQFMTSAWATAHYLQTHSPGAPVYVVGEPGLKQELEEAGLHLVENPEAQAADYVVVGIDRSFSYETLRRAQWAILNGAKFIATNRDATYPAENGRVLPGAGTIVAAIQTATGVEPVVIGKPNPYMLTFILERTGVAPAQTLLIGDRLETDIALGNRAGLSTALVLTGVTNAEALEQAPPEMKPEFVLKTLKELICERDA